MVFGVLSISLFRVAAYHCAMVVVQLGDPLPIFQSVFQAMLLGFTPFFGHNNLPDIDLRLAVHALTWIYECYADKVTFGMETLKVIEVRGLSCQLGENDGNLRALHTRN